MRIATFLNVCGWMGAVCVGMAFAGPVGAQPAPSSKAPGPVTGGEVAKQPERARPVNGIVTLDEKYVITERARGFMLMFVDFPEKEKEKLPEITRWQGERGTLLRKWFAEGTAAGNWGDLYENRDDGHAKMDWESFPQLTRVAFSENAKKAGLHSGLQARMFFTGVTLGNSSTALVNGPGWRSLTRLAYTGSPQLALALSKQYEGNHLYFYPEHKDYDPGQNGVGGGHGDVFPANTPYVVTTQGSSGSDRPFLDTMTGTLAAFRPEVKHLLKSKGGLIPALQMALRSSQKMVMSPDVYLTGAAHRPVFDLAQLDELRMIRLAHSFTLERTPPLVRIRMLEEDLGTPGIDYFDVGPREKLFDTPQAIARVHRSRREAMRMVVSADASSDLAGLPLTFHWKVLQGDSERIVIKPRNAKGTEAEIRIPYHARRLIAGTAMETNRVDIGIFVHNGFFYSAPAFVTVYTLDNEKREYDTAGRVSALDFTSAEKGRNYFDPLVATPGIWRDEYHYDERGEILGFTRVFGSNRQEFTADGALVLSRDAQGRALEARTIRYAASGASANERPKLEAILGKEIATYTYQDDQDRRGKIGSRRAAEK